MAKEIRLEKGFEDKISLYTKIEENRKPIQEILNSGYIKIGKYTHSGKKGSRGWDIYNNLHSTFKKVFGYIPKPGEKLSKEDLRKLEDTYKKAENYFRRRVEI